ncbi:MAG: hypothetical protein R2855_10275 [Thermomicrobiales bacterium]
MRTYPTMYNKMIASELRPELLKNQQPRSHDREGRCEPETPPAAIGNERNLRAYWNQQDWKKVELGLGHHRRKDDRELQPEIEMLIPVKAATQPVAGDEERQIDQEQQKSQGLPIRIPVRIE